MIYTQVAFITKKLEYKVYEMDGQGQVTKSFINLPIFKFISRQKLEDYEL